jgi:ribosomal protein S18 acetylase RimI-like enzyme
MSSSLPERFHFRKGAESDLETVATLVYAEEKHLRGNSEWGPAEMIDFWRRCDFDGGTWLVEADDGEPVGFAASMERDGETDCWAAVHPDSTGLGLSTALLAKIGEHARTQGSRKLKAGMFAENCPARALFEELGFREVRRYYHMRIVFDRPPEITPLPEGIELEPFRREDARAFHAAVGEAFEEEWGFVALPFEEWERTRIDAPDTDLSLWFVACDGNEIAGFVRCDPKKYGGGWIGMLGVRRPWRQRGIGLAMLQHAFAEFHRRGEPHVGLGVDADNPTGATRLYEKAGMRVLTEDIVFEKELA